MEEVNTSTSKTWFRLVHDWTNVICLIEAKGITETIHTIFEWTKEQCIAEISRLNLIYIIEE